MEAIKLFYENSAAQVITPDGETSFVDILTGIFQGDTLAPFLFIIVLDYALKQAFKISDECGIIVEQRRGSRYPEVRLKDLSYADDIALIIKSLQLAENLLHSVESSANLVGLHLNADKTKILTNNSIDNSYEVKTLSGHILKQVQNFKYLGAYMPDSYHEFNTRKGLAWAAVNQLDCIWKSSLNRNLKVKFFRACIESILLYNSQTWTVLVAWR